MLILPVSREKAKRRYIFKGDIPRKSYQGGDIMNDIAFEPENVYHHEIYDGEFSNLYNNEFKTEEKLSEYDYQSQRY